MMVDGIEGAKGTDDPRYQEGIAHLQAGAWQAAIDCFEALARDYPDSPAVQRALGEARFKASLDRGPRVRARRWNIPWRPILVRGLILAALVFLGVLAVRLVRGPVAEALEQIQADQEIARKERDCEALANGPDRAAARACYEELQVLVPGHEGAPTAIALLDEEQMLEELYLEGVAFQEAGDDAAAIAKFVQIQGLRSGYKDITQRIDEMQQQERREALFAQAEAAYAAGRAEEALSAFELLKGQYANYQVGVVDERLYTLHMQLGRGLLQQDPPTAEAVSQAQGHFNDALTLRPNDPEATLERDLATFYLEGQSRYQAGQWEGAIAALRAVRDRRPSYFPGVVAGMLYESYIRRGDQHRDAGDCSLAYERYGQAAALPVADTAAARARQSEVVYCMTPTPTPSITPTPTPVPTTTPWPTWTPVPPPQPPTPTPTPRPLAAFRGKILFRSDKEGEKGFWVMDPDGENRQYLGEEYFEYYLEQYQKLREAETYSPDGLRRAWTGAAGDTTAIYIEEPPHPEYGQLPPRRLTTLSHLTYDPVWSPDGGRIAFVSQENGSDDIWVVDADGRNARWLVRNDWEWDKHPSWSPNSQRIVFWSNRNLVWQIWMMEADGRNPRNISNTEWWEYDPIWIK